MLQGALFGRLVIFYESWCKIHMIPYYASCRGDDDDDTRP